MRTLPIAWRQAYIQGNRNYTVVIDMELSDGTTLTITNDDIWEGGFSFEEGTSDENSFSIGAAIIGKCTIILDNIDETYSAYNFFNAELDVYLNLVGLTTPNLLLGHYTVDETTYNGSLITLNALNNMWRFDIPFSSINFTFDTGTIARDVINAMCQYAGIGIQLATQSFQGYNFPVKKPEQDLTCREVLQHIAQATCNYCIINKYGNLELRWNNKSAINDTINYDGVTYNTHTTPYSDGDDVEGGEWYWDGDTYVWTATDEYDGGGFFDDTSTIGYITTNYSMEVGTDGIVVTGVKVCSSDQENEDAYDYSWHDATLEQTYPRYTLVIQDNVFINKNNASERCTTIGAILSNLPLRSFSASSLSDVSIETGDPVAINDFRGNRFYSFVTNVRFQTNNPESFSCGVESLTQNKTVRYSNEIKTLVEARRNAQEIVSAYDQAVKNMNALAQKAYGYNEYVYPETGNRVMWRYSGTQVVTTSPASRSNPKFPDSDIVWKIAANGVWISTSKDSRGFPIYSNGYDANTGTALLSMIYTVGLNAEWITAGSIDANRIKANVITAINNNSGTTTISGGKINIAGVVNGINAGSTTISGGKISTNSITANQIAANAIGTSELAANAVTAAKINAGAVTTDKLNANAVTADKILSNAITSDKINANAVTSAKISSNAITSDKIQANAVTADKMNVASLSAISADMGNLTAGSITGGTITGTTAITAQSGYIVVTGDGYIAHHQRDSGTSNQNVFDLGSYLCNCQYQDEGGYHWVNNGAQPIYKYLEGAYVVSDRRAKTKIKSLDPDFSVKLIMRTDPKVFEFKFKRGTKQFGMIAQDVNEVLEELGFTDKNALVSIPEKEEDMWSIEYKQYVPHLINMAKKQQEEIDLLKQELAELKARMK